MARVAGEAIIARRLAQTGFVAAALMVTGLGLVIPDLARTGNAPQLRTGLEVTSLCLLLFAAAVLALPPSRDVRPTRDALVAGIVVLGLANGVFGVLPVVTDGRLAIDRGLAFYPWIAARFVAGGLFLLAAVERPRSGLPRTIAFAIASLVVVEGVLVALGDRLAVPVAIVPGQPPTIEVVEPFVHVVLEAVPGALFALGAVLAGRLYDETRSPAHLALSLALILQVFTQVNQILHPAILGPIVSLADGFRLASFLALLVGSILQVQQLYRARTQAVASQAQDLTVQADLVDRMARLARQEHDLRSLVTHELASPLAAIRAYAHVLEARSDALPAQARRAAAGIAAEARRLADLVARMDELRDMEAESFDCDLQPVRARLLVADAAQFARGLLGVHPVTAACADVRVRADPVRLGQLLRNLVTNAVRHAPAGSPIDIEGACVDDHFEVSVTDEGPGVPVEERERVLERYARGSTADGSRGQGIGLYVAARIAEAHGGTLEIQDPPSGTGTRVVVTLELVR